MAWKATIIGKDFTDGTPYINVELNDGTTKIVSRFVARDTFGLKQQITNKIKDLTDAQTFIAATPDGVIDPTLAPSTPLTQAEIDRNTWLAKYLKLVKAKTTLVDTGIITAAQPTYAALLADVKAGLKAEYLDYL